MLSSHGEATVERMSLPAPPQPRDGEQHESIAQSIECDAEMLSRLTSGPSRRSPVQALKQLTRPATPAVTLQPFTFNSTLRPLIAAPVIEPGKAQELSAITARTGAPRSSATQRRSYRSMRPDQSTRFTTSHQSPPKRPRLQVPASTKPTGLAANADPISAQAQLTAPPDTTSSMKDVAIQAEPIAAIPTCTTAPQGIHTQPMVHQQVQTDCAQADPDPCKSRLLQADKGQRELELADTRETKLKLDGSIASLQKLLTGAQTAQLRWTATNEGLSMVHDRVKRLTESTEQLHAKLDAAAPPFTTSDVQDAVAAGISKLENAYSTSSAEVIDSLHKLRTESRALMESAKDIQHLATVPVDIRALLEKEKSTASSIENVHGAIIGIREMVECVCADGADTKGLLEDVKSSLATTSQQVSAVFDDLRASAPEQEHHAAELKLVLQYVEELRQRPTASPQVEPVNLDELAARLGRVFDPSVRSMLADCSLTRKRVDELSAGVAQCVALQSHELVKAQTAADTLRAQVQTLQALNSELSSRHIVLAHEKEFLQTQLLEVKGQLSSAKHGQIQAEQQASDAQIKLSVNELAAKAHSDLIASQSDKIHSLEAQVQVGKQPALDAPFDDYRAETAEQIRMQAKELLRLLGENAMLARVNDELVADGSHAMALQKNVSDLEGATAILRNDKKALQAKLLDQEAVLSQLRLGQAHRSTWTINVRAVSSTKPATGRVPDHIEASSERPQPVRVADHKRSTYSLLARPATAVRPSSGLSDICSSPEHLSNREIEEYLDNSAPQPIVSVVAQRASPVCSATPGIRPNSSSKRASAQSKHFRADNAALTADRRLVSETGLSESDMGDLLDMAIAAGTDPAPQPARIHVSPASVASPLKRRASRVAMPTPKTLRFTPSTGGVGPTGTRRGGLARARREATPARGTAAGGTPSTTASGGKSKKSNVKYGATFARELSTASSRKL